MWHRTRKRWRVFREKRRQLQGTNKKMEILTTDIKLFAFYEIARRANLTDNPNLVNLPAFQKAKELYEQ